MRFKFVFLNTKKYSNFSIPSWQQSSSFRLHNEKKSLIKVMVPQMKGISSEIFNLFWNETWIREREYLTCQQFRSSQEFSEL